MGGQASTVLGIQAHISDRTVSPPDFAVQVAERGLASLYLCEHTHIPVDSKSSSPRGFLPEWTKRIPDPYVSLAAVAVAAPELEIGTAIGLPGQHDPINLAKQIATLDQLCGGRFVYGVGWGWNREEYANHTGLAPNTRAAVMLEHIEIMRRLWSDEVAEYHGEHSSLAASWSWPKPARLGGPPVLLGVPANERNFRRIVDHGDGWIPMDEPTDMDQPSFLRGFPDALAQLRTMWGDAGREVDDLDVSVLRALRNADDIARALDRGTELGLRRLLILFWEDDLYDPGAILDEVVRGARLAGVALDA